MSRPGYFEEMKMREHSDQAPAGAMVLGDKGPNGGGQLVLFGQLKPVGHVADDDLGAGARVETFVGIDVAHTVLGEKVGS